MIYSDSASPTSWDTKISWGTTMRNEDDYDSDAKVMTTTFVPENSKFYHLFNFVACEYGSDMEKAFKRAGALLLAGSASNFIKNKQLKFLFRVLQIGIPTFLFTSDFVLHLKHYMKKIKDEQQSMFTKRIYKICKILQVNEENLNKVSRIKSYFNPEIISWLFTQPKTELIKITNFYDVNTTEKLQTTSIEKSSTNDICIAFEYKKQKFVIDFSFALYNDRISLNSQWVLSELTFDIEEIKRILTFEYVKSFNIKENVLRFDYEWGLITTTPRRTVEDIINQFDVEDFSKEISYILEKERKRAIAFVGPPGVGKSLILRYIENKFRNTVIFHLTSIDFNDPTTIKDRFEVMKLFKGCIVMIEDIDSCGLASKNRKTGVFLECIDEVNKDLSMVILVTINNTKLVHPTILNRPGRFDRVIEIQSPQSINEIYQVIKSRFYNLERHYNIPDGKSFVPARLDNYLKPVVKTILDNRFTQAEITNAIIEQAVIDISTRELWKKLNKQKFAEHLNQSINKHIKTRNAIKKYSFNEDLDGLDYKSDAVIEPTPAKFEDDDIYES